jgi:hypothetical protein
LSTKLQIYNKALVHLEERQLSALTDSVEPRRVLDSIWDDSVAYCLEEGQWKFAKRVVEIEASDSIDPAFGYTYAFPKPSDWLRLTAIAADDNFSAPLNDYSEEGDYWYANTTPIYVAYVSNDSEWGGDLGKWPASFARRVALHLASETGGRITSNSELQARLMAKERDAKRVARSIDAMNGPAVFPPAGSWVRARRNNAFNLSGTKRGLP